MAVVVVVAVAVQPLFPNALPLAVGRGRRILLLDCCSCCSCCCVVAAAAAAAAGVVVRWCCYCCYCCCCSCATCWSYSLARSPLRLPGSADYKIDFSVLWPASLPSTSCMALRRIRNGKAAPNFLPKVTSETLFLLLQLLRVLSLLLLLLLRLVVKQLWKNQLPGGKHYAPEGRPRSKTAPKTCLMSHLKSYKKQHFCSYCWWWWCRRPLRCCCCSCCSCYCISAAAAAGGDAGAGICWCYCCCCCSCG